MYGPAGPQLTESEMVEFSCWIMSIGEGIFGEEMKHTTRFFSICYKVVRIFAENNLLEAFLNN